MLFFDYTKEIRAKEPFYIFINRKMNFSQFKQIFVSVGV